MNRTLIKSLLYLIILLFLAVIYLSQVGVKTKRFNNLIETEIQKINENIKVEIINIKINLNPLDFSMNLKTRNTLINFNNSNIDLEEVTTIIPIKSFLKRDFTFKNLTISSRKNKVKDLIQLLKIYKNSPELFILNKLIKKGSIITKVNINFNKDGKIKENFSIEGKVLDGQIKLLDRKEISKINFNFYITKNKYQIKNLATNYDGLNLSSDVIKLEDKINFFEVTGNIEKNLGSINNKFISYFFDESLNDYLIEDVVFAAKNNFSFKFDKKFNFSNINIESDINLKDAKFKENFLKIQKFFPTYKSSINFEDHKIKIKYNKQKTTISGKGNFLINDKKEIIKYEISKKNNIFNFNTDIKLSNTPITVNVLNYETEEDYDSLININGYFKKGKEIYIQNVSLIENKNEFLFKKIELNRNYKIISVDNVTLKFTNKDNIKNKINLKRNKKSYEIIGSNFDATNLINKILDTQETGSLFSNLNTNIVVDIKKTYLDNISFINNLKGNIKYKNNKIHKLDLESYFPNNKKIIMSINTNENSERITTLFSSHPKPLIKRYRFVKGFEEGVLDFYSIKNNKVSNSVLKIDNFKVKEVPVLAKLLTLASLQGIADLLTGEGIRFTDFEMKFSNQKNFMKINEIYAIGPAISIMMDGYIEEDKLVSMRGTLVPATTINRTISSIPIIGDLLVGKKTGEGVFGVSFKIKGPPDNLKTSVNPIKTLTPRFITRTLEKIKKN